MDRSADRPSREDSVAIRDRLLPSSLNAAAGDAAESPNLGGSQRDRPSAARFTDVARDAGIDFTYYNDEVPNRFFLPEVMGGGLAWLDFDRDGRWDLYAVNGCRLPLADDPMSPRTNRLFRAAALGTFHDVTPHCGDAADPGFGQGCAVGDYNADGFDDLFVANYGSQVLLVNNGDGTFSEVTASAGVADHQWGTSAAWVDLDQDGLLDLYVVHYLNVTFENLKLCKYQEKPGYCGPGQYESQPDRVYRNEGDGTFRDVTTRWGFEAPDGKGLVVAAVDLDNDTWPEVYVGNDMTANFLFTRSHGPGAATASVAGHERLYRELARVAGCATSDTGQNEATMGLVCGDFDRDGLIDLFLSHYYQQKNTLYRNLGQLTFKDDSRRTRIAATSFDYLAFGAAALDFDRDGWLDLFVANGHVLGPLQEPNAMRPQLLRNDGGGRFEDVSDGAGEYFLEKVLGRGVAAADFDNDGDLDIAVSHLHRPIALLRNDSPSSGHFVGFHLTTPLRAHPAGARVVVRSASESWVVPVVSGGSYLSQHDARLLLSLPDAGPVDLEVYWPGGQVDHWESLGTDTYWRLAPGRVPVLCAPPTP